jgi:hypothetical protein
MTSPNMLRDAAQPQEKKPSVKRRIIVWLLKVLMREAGKKV